MAFLPRRQLVNELQEMADHCTAVRLDRAFGLRRAHDASIVHQPGLMRLFTIINPKTHFESDRVINLAPLSNGFRSASPPEPTICLHKGTTKKCPQRNTT